MTSIQSRALKVDGQTVSAEQFYAIACDPGRSVAVEACAGAGKTWMLVSRMLRALLADEASGACQPHEILAITFTRKAAGEMRERLYEWLQEFAHADDHRLMQGLHERGVPGLEHPAVAAALCERLRGLYGALLANGRAVQIRTFHGWFSSLLRMAPVALLQQLRLPVHYELLEDDTQAKNMAWRKFLAALVDSPSDKADFEALVQAHGRSQAQKALLAALDKRVEFELADAAGKVQTSVRAIDQQFARCAGLSTVRDVLSGAAQAQLLMDAAQILQALRAKSFSAIGVDLQRAIEQVDLDGVIDSLLTGQSSGRGPRSFGQASSNEAIRQAQSLAQELLQMQRQEQAWLHQRRMARLTRLLIEQFRSLKLERGWMDMNDIEQAAVHLLSDDSLSGWVQERLDAQVRHLLVDEFQDTNPMQWQALRSWLHSYAGAGRAPSVFIVGDPKQSIYRFRRAEPQVFRDAQQFVQSALGGARLSCDHTRRNAQQVIGVVNAVMADAAAVDAYVGFGAHTTQSDQPGQVVSLPAVSRPVKPEVLAPAERPWRDSLTQPRWLPEDRQRDLEAGQAAAWIARQISERGISANDVMVLARKRDSLKPMQLALRAQGVPASIGENISLMDCCEVQDLVALMDVLVSPRHNLSLARVLRSPLFGLDTGALVPLARAAQRTGQSWLDLLQQGDPLPPEFEQAQAVVLQPLGDIFRRWQGWLRGLPPHDALQAIYDDGDVLARYAGAAPQLQRDSVLSHLRALLEVTLAHDGGRYLTAYALVRALKAGTIEVAAALRPDAVRLLTIHGAKGLEADTVLMLDTDAAPRASDTMSVLVDWPGQSAHPQTFVFLESESRPPPCAVSTLGADLQARSREELNALYVAMTRARHVLAVSACEPFRDSGRSWRKRLDPWTQSVDVDNMSSAPPGLASTPAPVKPSVVFLPVLPENTTKRAVDPAPPAPTVLARMGLAMHRLLEWGTTSPAHVRLAAREFRLNAVESRQAGEAAERILQGQGAWMWDSIELIWQGSEVELIHDGRLMRLDRLVQHRDGTWWVVDFKSHAQPQTQDDLVLQLAGYAQAVSALHPGQAVRAAFLTAQGTVVEISVASS